MFADFEACFGTVRTCSWPSIILWMSSNSLFSFLISPLYTDASRQPEELDVELRSARPRQQKRRNQLINLDPRRTFLVQDVMPEF